ncbi:MAG: hypothetical protein WKF66_10135 [Pedobacter sp.]
MTRFVVEERVELPYTTNWNSTYGNSLPIQNWSSHLNNRLSKGQIATKFN